MTPFWILGIIGACVLIEYAAIDRAAKRAHRAGCKFGYDEGYLKGFEAGHASAEQWWNEAEVAVQIEREAIWRDER